MNSTVDLQLQQRFKNLSGYMNIMVMVIAVFVLAGWQFNIALFKHPIPGSTSMNPVTAIAFVLASSSFFLLTASQRSKQLILAGIIFALMVMTIGIIRFSEVVMDFGWSVDRLVYSEALGQEGDEAGRMAPNTAISFIFLGIGLLIINIQIKGKLVPVQHLAFVIALLALLSILGYLYQVEAFYGVFTYVPMAVYSAVCFLLMALSMLFVYPDRGVMAEFTSNLSGSITARRLIPAAIIIPAVLGLVRMLAYGAGLFTREFGITVLVLSIIIIFGGLIWYNALLLNKRDRQHQRIEEEIYRTNTFLNTVLENIPNMIFIKDAKNLRFMRFNKAGENLLGYSREVLLGKNDYDLFPKEQADFFIQKDRSVLAQKELIDITEEPIDTIQGRRWLHTQKIPILDENGTPLYLLGISEDVTERKKYEDAIKKINVELEQKVIERTGEVHKSEKRFRALIENSVDAIMMVSKEGAIIYASPAVERMTDFTIEEIKNKNGFDLLHPEELTETIAFLEKVLQEPSVPQHRVLRLRHKSGRYIWIEGTITNLLHDEGVEAVVANFRDITDRKQDEEKLIKSEKIYKTIASNIPQSAIVIFDTTLKCILAEGEALKLLGYSQEDLVGKHAADTFAPEYYGKVKPYYERVLRGEEYSEQFNVRGSCFFIRGVALKDDQDNVYAGMLISTDISEIKKAQNEISALNKGLEKKVEERTAQLEEVNRELEAFTYSVSHDLRAPLRSINGFTQILQEDYKDKLDEEGLRLFQIVQRNAQKMGLLIDDLLTFSRLGKQEIQKNKINMSQLAKSVLMDIQRDVPANSFEIHIDDLYSAKGDYALIQQVWINLMSNAVKYSRKTSHPQIKISSEESDTEYIYFVKDNGVGFDMRYVNKLFGVFQRLHKPADFEGTGVGLAIVHRIITKHGGKVWAEGKVGEGASFYFTLPKDN